MASTPSRCSVGERGVHRGGVERGVDLSVMGDALRDLAAQVARDQRLRLFPGEIVEARDADAAQFQDIAEARGGEQAGARAAAFDDGVGGDGGAVHDGAAVRRRQREFGEQLVKDGEDAALVGVRRGHAFGDGDLTGRPR